MTNLVASVLVLESLSRLVFVANFEHVFLAWRFDSSHNEVKDSVISSK